MPWPSALGAPALGHAGSGRRMARPDRQGGKAGAAHCCYTPVSPLGPPLAEMLARSQAPDGSMDVRLRPLGPVASGGGCRPGLRRGSAGPVAARGTSSLAPGRWTMERFGSGPPVDRSSIVVHRTDRRRQVGPGRFRLAAPKAIGASARPGRPASRPHRPASRSSRGVVRGQRPDRAREGLPGVLNLAARAGRYHSSSGVHSGDRL